MPKQPSGKRELLFSLTKKDFVITWFSGSGGGGQHRNKHANCCRIQHPESGAMATGQDQRSRPQNQKAAIRRLIETPKFKIWHKRKCHDLINKIDTQKEIEKAVDEAMRPENIEVEVKKDGKWVKEDE